ncbi:tRNA modification GTPase MnmE (macronuclear) [Tetrahymena thermophila SB210]|uniref:tRNA modification GTPase MnmE n=1 Tax=Tetrahymena thermophila (strain SB210) TaxID=312017 RepID=I7MAY8_TETTS|nr:tRNA modification GTPase MnmE [Tetrahymena thermophila SB210]EAS06744.2 tRNA modification GTPase MnmE [Tetrahymena thermophila SB210]|eukprot:XP_001026986.2 tRNA modification GTPase MnmE [Tetrahymena thermophila SB210]
MNLLKYNKLQFISRYQFCSTNIHFSDNIYAIASGNVKAGVSIIRISGSNCLQAGQMLVQNAQQRQLIKGMNNSQVQDYLNLKNRYAHFKKLYSLIDPTVSPQNQSFQKQDLIYQQIDQGIFMYFQGPKSYTGEDIVEMHIHGSRALQKKVLLELSQLNNFRLADPGEFTKRAMINNKLDLLEVEGLADLLNSETESQRVQSTQQFLGKSSQILEDWRFQLIRALAHAEAFIDFESDQDDVEFNILGKTQENVQQVIKDINEQLSDRNRGEILRDGMKISIIGKPNAGKSTLLNCLAKKDIAIVSEIPGTTRDALSVSLNISGFPILLYDTAGIRQTKDVIEEKGVNKALQHARESDLNIWIIDIDDVIKQADGSYIVQDIKEISEILESNQNTLIFINKIDKVNSQKEITDITIRDKKFKIDGQISAQHNQNINSLLDKLTKKINERLDITDGIMSSGTISIITQTRHRLELQKCLEHLEIFSRNKQNLPVDIVCEELRQAVNCIGRITGRVDVEEVLDVLFSEFCIGK